MLLHGFLQSHKSMLAMAKHLSDLRNIILVDLPGFGASKSVGHDYNMKDVTYGLKDILVQLDIERVDVLGYSMGGRTALAFSLEHKACVSALYLESASPGLEDKDQRNERYIIDIKRHDSMISDYPSFIKEWEDLPLFKSQKALDPVAFKRQSEERLSQDAHEAADSLLKYGTSVQPSYWSRLTELDFPVYIIVGEKDQKFVDIARSMSERMKGATLIIVESCGHNIHLENFKLFIELIRKRLK